MRIAIGYCWFPIALGYHLERALLELGHEVTYVGTPSPHRAGYDQTVPLNELVQHLATLPDLYLWVDPGGRYFPPGIEDLPIPTACYLVDVHLGHWREQVARFFDGVFIAQKDYLPGFRRAVGHDQVHWLPLGAAPDVHRRLDLPRIYDVGFVGNISYAHRSTPRARRLKAIAARWRTNDFYRHYTPDEVGQVYSQSRIVFNTSIAGDVNMRVFEGTASGALVLTDSIANGLGELFEIGREIVTYKNDADLFDKIAYYLDHEDERQAIAQAGYDRTHTQHTYAHRMKWLLERVTDPSFRRVAPMRGADESKQWVARREVYTHLYALDAILDASRRRKRGALQRAWDVLPCFVRRLIF